MSLHFYPLKQPYNCATFVTTLSLALSTLKNKNRNKQNTKHSSLLYFKMSNFFSIAKAFEWYHRYSFQKAGLQSTTTDLGEGTVMHCWAPKAHDPSKPNLLLIHGMGANAMWQWNQFVSHFVPHFNLYVPDLVFFGESRSTRPERSEAFQAQCVMGLMEAKCASKNMRVVGISYGGFVAYNMATRFKERVERVVLCCTGVCMEDRDMEEGLFKVKSVDEAVSILLPQNAEKMRELLRLTFVKPHLKAPSCILNDFINVSGSLSLIIYIFKLV